MEKGLWKIENEEMSVTVNEFGAQMWSILGKDATEYLWQGDPKYWSERAINLFPYVGRMPEKSYSLDGKTYQMDLHGFASGCRFAVKSHEKTRLVMELQDNPQTYIHYPRHFLFRVIFSLRKNTLEITYEVENQDERKMYFGLGGHPGFNVPLKAGKKFEDYHLRFHGKCEPVKIGFAENHLLNGEDCPFPLEKGYILKLYHELFQDGVIVLKGTDKTVTLECEDDSHSVTVSFPQMPYFGIWHLPNSDAPYVCFEPWCSLPSADGKSTIFEEKDDLICLMPHRLYKNVWEITVCE